MGYLFVAERLVVEDPSIPAIDSTLLKDKGHVWHKSSMKKGIVPYPCIDTDASEAIVIPKDGSLDINYI